MSATNATEDLILNWLLRNTAPVTVGSVYVALFTSDPGETGSYASEVAGNGYDRQLVTFSDPALGGSSSNTNVIDSDIATADWASGADITHYAICNALTGTSGLMLVRAAFSVPFKVLLGGKFQAAVGDLTVSHT